MSSELPPPPAGPPPYAGPPAGPPTPAAPAAPAARSRLPLVVGGALVLLLAVVVVLVVTLTGSKAAQDARTVTDVADIAVAAAQDLDVDAGVDLLCEAPSSGDREILRDLIEEGQGRAGTEDPDVDYEVSEVEGDRTGSFRVHISSSEVGLEDAELDLRVEVATQGERSCIEALQP